MAALSSSILMFSDKIIQKIFINDLTKFNVSVSIKLYSKLI